MLMAGSRRGVLSFVDAKASPFRTNSATSAARNFVPYDRQPSPLPEEWSTIHTTGKSRTSTRLVDVIKLETMATYQSTQDDPKHKALLRSRLTRWGTSSANSSRTSSWRTMKQLSNAMATSCNNLVCIHVSGLHTPLPDYKTSLPTVDSSSIVSIRSGRQFVNSINTKWARVNWLKRNNRVLVGLSSLCVSRSMTEFNDAWSYSRLPTMPTAARSSVFKPLYHKAGFSVVRVSFESS